MMDTGKALDQAAAAVLAAPAAKRLFVYGTLLSAAGGGYGQTARLRLLREAPLRRPARIAGRLYELGDYPGLVTVGGDPADIVHGELIVLLDPAATWPWLDEYEMISPDVGADNEYARIVRDVALDGVSGTVQAWTYVYRKPVTGLSLIAGGSWLQACRAV
jgi:gamma-glutamylcyclotransferase (GGCT)/AIG2-like uncharacterized protein YtfP